MTKEKSRALALTISGLVCGVGLGFYWVQRHPHAPTPPPGSVAASPAFPELTAKATPLPGASPAGETATNETAPLPIGKTQTLTSSELNASLSPLPGATRDRAADLFAKCQGGIGAACTRLGVMAIQANKRTFGDFRRMALSLSCERGDGVFSCSHAYKEDSGEEGRRNMRVLLNQKCQAGDERICTALGIIVTQVSSSAARALFEKACDISKDGFGCGYLAELLIQTAPKDSDRNARIAPVRTLCDQAKPGACYQLSKQLVGDEAARREARGILEKICLDENLAKGMHPSPWVSPSCAALTSIELQADEKDKAVDTYARACAQPSETEIGLCRTLAVNLTKAKPQSRNLILDTLKKGCAKVQMEAEDCAF